MTRKTVGWLIVSALVCVAAYAIATHTEVRSIVSPGYRLDAKTETTHGIRLGYKTTYRFYRGEALLWERTTRDRYLNHWITPEGRVWIASGQYPGPGGGGSVNVWDPEGAVECRMPVFLSSLPSSSDEDFRSATLERPRGNDLVEALEVRNGESKDRYIVLRSPESGVQTFDPSLIRGRMDPTWVEALYGVERDLPRLVSRVDGWHSVWQSGKAYWLLQERVDPDQKPGEPLAHFIVKRVPGKPTLAQLLPSSRRAWFLMDDGLVVIYDHDWNEIHTTNLLKLGGFQSIAEMKGGINLDTLRSSNGYAWFDSSNRGSYEECVKYEQFEILDAKGRHIVWTIDARNAKGTSISNEVLTGPAARHKVELEAARYVPVSESKGVSPNKRFILRVRKYVTRMSGREPEPKWVATLLSNERADDGSTLAVEVWSHPSYIEVIAPFVSDSGLSGYFSIGSYTNSKSKESFDSKVCFLWRPSGQQLAGLELTKQVGGLETPYDSVKEARERTLVELTKFESSGTPSLKAVNGLVFPDYPIEKLTIYRKGGRPVDYTYWNGQVAHKTRD